MRWWSWVIVVSSMTLVCFLKVSPIYILICVIVGAAFISWYNNRKITGLSANDGKAADDTDAGKDTDTENNGDTDK